MATPEIFSTAPLASDDWSPNPEAHTLSLPEQIAKRIGSAIITGEIEEGCRLHEVELSERFQVSRAPIREALRILERDGLINLHARRGAQVTELSASELNNIFDPRIVLNGLLARRVAEKADAVFAARFLSEVQLMEQFVSQGNTDDYARSVLRLHRLLGTGCDNPYLNRLVFVLTHQTARYTRLGLSTVARRQQSVSNWKKVAKAISAGNGDGAQAAAEQLARDSRDMAMKLLAQKAGIVSELRSEDRTLNANLMSLQDEPDETKKTRGRPPDRARAARRM